MEKINEGLNGKKTKLLDPSVDRKLKSWQMYKAK